MFLIISNARSHRLKIKTFRRQVGKMLFTGYVLRGQKSNQRAFQLPLLLISNSTSHTFAKHRCKDINVKYGALMGNLNGTPGINLYFLVRPDSLDAGQHRLRQFTPPRRGSVHRQLFVQQNN